VTLVGKEQVGVHKYIYKRNHLLDINIWISARVHTYIDHGHGSDGMAIYTPRCNSDSRQIKPNTHTNEQKNGIENKQIVYV